MSRAVIVECVDCNCEMLLELQPEKADGGFYACDIEHELKDCGWTLRDGKEVCDECSPLPQGEKP